MLKKVEPMPELNSLTNFLIKYEGKKAIAISSCKKYVNIILKKLEKEDISVSLSIDGPKEIHDQHRLDHKGKRSFDKVYSLEYNVHSQDQFHLHQL